MPKKPSGYSGQPKLVKHTPNGASGSGNSPAQPKLVKHSPGQVSGSGGRKRAHPLDGVSKG